MLKKPSANWPLLETSLSLPTSAWPGAMVSMAPQHDRMHMDVRNLHRVRKSGMLNYPGTKHTMRGVMDAKQLLEMRFTYRDHGEPKHSPGWFGNSINLSSGLISLPEPITSWKMSKWRSCSRSGDWIFEQQSSHRDHVETWRWYTGML